MPTPTPNLNTNDRYAISGEDISNDDDDDDKTVIDSNRSEERNNKEKNWEQQLETANATTESICDNNWAIGDIGVTGTF